MIAQRRLKTGLYNLKKHLSLADKCFKQNKTKTPPLTPNEYFLKEGSDPMLLNLKGFFFLTCTGMIISTGTRAAGLGRGTSTERTPSGESEEAMAWGDTPIGSLQCAQREEVIACVTQCYYSLP